MKTLRIRTDVRLSPLSIDAAPAMLQWMSDPDVSMNIGLRRNPTLEATRTWIKSALHDPSVRPYSVLFCGTHVGNVVLDKIDRHLNTGRLSVYVGEASARGAGVGTSAVYRALDSGFNEHGLFKIWLTVHARNFRAVDVYSRLGFALEGILRGEFLMGDERLDCLYMGVLHDEFRRLNVVMTDAQ